MTRLLFLICLLCMLISPVKAHHTAIAGDTIKIELSKNDSITFISNKKKGTIIQIELEGALAGTGYIWKNLTPSSSAIVLVNTDAVVINPELMGSSTKNIYLYKITGKTGCLELNFKLQRAWESDDKIIKKFHHTIRVCRQIT